MAGVGEELAGDTLGGEMGAPPMEGAAATALRSVLSRVQQAAERSDRPTDRIRVLAVSKTKPISRIREVYDAGHRCFGENYVQEIVEKAPQLPADIEWHFIGHLQSNKAKSLLAGVPNLEMVETVDDEKVIIQSHDKIINAVKSLVAKATFGNFFHFFPFHLPFSAVGFEHEVTENKFYIANHLDRAVANLGRKPLKVLVQVNTSGEESKYGVEPSGCIKLAKHVELSCPNLIFSGLMTIGMLDYSSTPENFKTLSNCRAEVCKELGIPEEQCALSMGMSADFEQAVRNYDFSPFS